MIPNPLNWFGEYPLTLSLSPSGRGNPGISAADNSDVASSQAASGLRMRGTPERSAADTPRRARPNGERDRVRGDFLKQRKQIERVRYEG